MACFLGLGGLGFKGPFFGGTSRLLKPQKTGRSAKICGGKPLGVGTPTDPPILSRKIVPFLGSLDIGRGTPAIITLAWRGSAWPLVIDALDGNLVLMSLGIFCFHWKYYSKIFFGHVFHWKYFIHA